MPFISVKTIEGTLSAEQKNEMIAGVTEAVVAVEGEFVRPYTWVVIEEIAGSDWGFGGQAASEAAIAAAKTTVP